MMMMMMMVILDEEEEEEEPQDRVVCRMIKRMIKSSTGLSPKQEQFHFLTKKIEKSH